MKKERVTYSCQDQEFTGELILPAGDKPHPVIMIAHAWKGRDAFVRSKGEEICVNLGIGAFVLDLYGIEEPVETDEEATALMMPLFINRKLLRARMGAAYEALSSQPLVDADRIGAIGFCFGGLACLELFKTGLPLKGVVAFHPVLGETMMEQKAQTEPPAKGLSGSILVLTGQLDPLVSQEDINQFKKEMTEADVDWQLHIYGKAYHAFTNPQAHDIDSGLVYDPIANRRAWHAMATFFTALV